MRMVQTHKEPECQQHRAVVFEGQEKEYWLLQEVPHTRIQVHKCRLSRSRIPTFCGHYDHQTLLTPDIWMNKPVPISADDCRALHATQKYTVFLQPGDGTKKAMEFDLEMNSTNFMDYEAHGTTSLHPNEVECVGVSWFSDTAGTKINNVIEYRGDHLEVSQGEGLVQADGRVTLHNEQIQLPDACRAAIGSCTTKEGTWFWNPPTAKEKCPLFVARKLRGRELKVMDGGEMVTTFIDDSKLVRLVIRESVYRCQTLMWSTNAPTLFLLEKRGGGNPHFDFPDLHPADLSEIVYLNQQDSWLLGEAKRTITTVTQNFLLNLCHRESANEREQFAAISAHHQAVLQGGAVALGKGMFATPVGEAWKVYKCRALDVQARDTDACYDSLPIQLSIQDQPALAEFERKRRREEADLLDLEEEERREPEEVEFFLEPNSHLITSLAAKLPCLPQFAPYYQNKQGQWVAMGPALRLAATPEYLAREKPHLLHQTGQEEEPDFYYGGIYSPLALLRMARHRLLPRVREIALQEISSVLPSTHFPTTIQVSSFARRIGIPKHPVAAFMENFMAFARGLGLFMSTVVGLYTLFQMLMWVAGFIRRCVWPAEERVGWIPRFLAACMPSLVQLVANLCPFLCYVPPKDEYMPERRRQRIEDHREKDRHEYLTIQRSPAPVPPETVPLVPLPPAAPTLDDILGQLQDLKDKWDRFKEEEDAKSLSGPSAPTERNQQEKEEPRYVEAAAVRRARDEAAQAKEEAEVQKEEIYDEVPPSEASELPSSAKEEEPLSAPSPKIRKLPVHPARVSVTSTLEEIQVHPPASGAAALTPLEVHQLSSFTSRKSVIGRPTPAPRPTFATAEEIEIRRKEALRQGGSSWRAMETSIGARLASNLFPALNAPSSPPASGSPAPPERGRQASPPAVEEGNLLYPPLGGEADQSFPLPPPSS